MNKIDRDFPAAELNLDCDFYRSQIDFWLNAFSARKKNKCFEIS
jgi:hypothetical protein